MIHVRMDWMKYYEASRLKRRKFASYKRVHNLLERYGIEWNISYSFDYKVP